MNRHHNNQQIKVLIVALFIGSAVFAVLIYFNMHPAVRQVQQTPSNEQTPAEQPDKKGDGPAANLTDEEMKRIASEGPSSSPAVAQATLDMAAKNATKTGVISLGADCKPSPQAVQIQAGASVTYHNSSADSYTISFGDPTRTFSIPANTTTTVDPALKSPGIYGYSCGDSLSAVGTVVIIE